MHPRRRVLGYARLQDLRQALHCRTARIMMAESRDCRRFGTERVQCCTSDWNSENDSVNLVNTLFDHEANYFIPIILTTEQVVFDIHIPFRTLVCLPANNEMGSGCPFETHRPIGSSLHSIVGQVVWL